MVLQRRTGIALAEVLERPEVAAEVPRNAPRIGASPDR